MKLFVGRRAAALETPAQITLSEDARLPLDARAARVCSVHEKFSKKGPRPLERRLPAP